MAWQKISQTLGFDRTGMALQGLWNAVTGGADQSEPRNSVAFTMAVVTLAAKMAKADGVALAVEAEAFHRLFDVPDAQQGNVVKLYELAKQDTAGFEIYSEKIANLLADEPATLRWVLECLFHIASADGILHPEEDKFLSEVADLFGIGADEYRTIRSSFVSDPDSPYTILGVTPDISDGELKTRHRQLVIENHPDRMIAHGMPADFRAAADRRLRTINAAYDEILKLRGLKPVPSAEPVS